MQTIKALDEMGIKIYLCASSYPDATITSKRLGIDVSNSISGFFKGINRHDIPPILQPYQMMIYSHFSVKKFLKQYDLDFIIITGEPIIVPRKIANKTIAYIHFPVGLFTAQQREMESRITKIQVKTWQYISNINRVTLLTNSNYEKNLITKAWAKDATVIYPPSPQYSFSLNHFRDDVVCTLARFTPDKDYETVLEVARRLPDTKFELLGSVSPENLSYSEKLRNIATKNVTFHMNATIKEKISVLMMSKVLLHTFAGEHFGIAIVEAMSAGIIPVTFDSGAAKVDGLVKQRFRYLDIDGAVKSVNDALSSWNCNEARMLREKAKNYSPESFKEKITLFISSWLRSKNLS